MILTDQKVDVQSNFQFASTTAMEIDYESLGHILELLTTYSNPYRAALREYASNAYDAWHEGGQVHPVEISLPSELSPNLVVEDYGQGLTKAEMDGFGQYGKSSKRDSNGKVGGFGLGSKTGLAAGSHFIVRSVKNGLATTAVVQRDEDGRPFMGYLEEETPTSDMNGTRITVPIANLRLLGKLEDFFIGWERGSVYIDGEEPTYSLHDPEDFQDFGGIAYRGLRPNFKNTEKLRAVIGPVSYELERYSLGLNSADVELWSDLVIRLDNGSVKLTPTREAVVYNAKTKDHVRDRLAEVRALAEVEYRKAVENAETARVAFQAREQMRKLGFDVVGLKYKDEVLAGPGYFNADVEGTKIKMAHDGQTKNGWSAQRGASFVNSLQPWTNKDTIVLIHSAQEMPEDKYGNIRHHREAYSLHDWLIWGRENHPELSGKGKVTFFVTTHGLDELDPWTPQMVTLVVDGADYLATVDAVRENRRKENRANYVPRARKKRYSTLRVLQPYSSGQSSIHEVPIEDFDDDYSSIILHRGDPNEELIIRGFTTRKGYYDNSSYYDLLLALAEKHNWNFVVLNKTDNRENWTKNIPNVINMFDEILAQLWSTHTPGTPLEQRAQKDREDYSLGLLTGLSDAQVAQIERAETREWVLALRPTSFYSASKLRQQYQPAIYKDSRFKDAFDGKGLYLEEKDLPESPYSRYEFLKHVDQWTPKEFVVQMINLFDNHVNV